MNIKTVLSLLALAVAPFAFAEGDKPGKKHEHKPEHKHAGEGRQIAEKAGVDAATMEKIKAAHQAAAKDPEFIKARDAVKAAQEKAKADKTPESREAVKTARDAAKKAHEAAMIKADPSVAEPLAKLEKARAEAEKSCKDCDDKECKDCDGEKSKGEKGKGHKGKGKGEKKPEAAQA